MEALQASVPFQLYVFAAAFTVIKLVFIAYATIAARNAGKTTTLPEDIKFGNTVLEAETDKVNRIQRVHRNALENELPFLVLGLVYVLCGASVLGAAAYFGVFIAARLLHSVFMLLKVQPWRSFMFILASLALIGMAVGSCLRIIR
jgi:uncharacterized MAPEG superfamily protein